MQQATITWIVVLCAAIAGAGEPSGQSVQKWFRQLDSDQFGQREQASRCLIEAGAEAAAAVAEAARSKTPETSDRAFRVLAALLGSTDATTRLAAYDALRTLTASDTRTVSRRAAGLLKSPALLKWIKAAGGNFRVDESTPHKPIVELRLGYPRGVDRGFSPDPVGDEELKLLKPLCELRTLTLESRGRVTDAALKHLGAMTQLESLNLRNTSITGSGFSDLSALSHLKSLDLSLCGRLSEDNLRYLRGLPSLAALSFEGVSHTWSNKESWVWRLRTVRRIRVRQPSYPDQSLAEERGGVTDSGVAIIITLPHLKALSLVKTRITDKALTSLAGLDTLESLNLTQTDVSDAGLKQLASCANLRELSLDLTPVGDAGLEHLASLTHLEKLSLSGTGATDEGLTCLGRLKGLSFLDLSYTEVTDEGLIHLESLKNLKEVDLRRTQVTLVGLHRLVSSLPHLDFQAAVVAAGIGGRDENGDILSITLTGRPAAGNEDLAHLREFPKVQHLRLDGTRTTDAGLLHLQELTSLKRLSLGGTKVTNAGLAHLRALKGLEWIGISN